MSFKKDKEEITLWNINFFGEETDITPIPSRYNTVIKNKYGNFKLVNNSVWDEWDMAIIFPDNEKADYFCNHFEKGMNDYRDGMLRDNYIFHIIHFKYPKVNVIYADQINMSKEYESFQIR